MSILAFCLCLLDATLTIVPCLVPLRITGSTMRRDEYTVRASLMPNRPLLALLLDSLRSQALTTPAFSNSSPLLLPAQVLAQMAHIVGSWMMPGAHAGRLFEKLVCGDAFVVLCGERAVGSITTRCHLHFFLLLLHNLSRSQRQLLMSLLTYVSSSCAAC